MRNATDKQISEKIEELKTLVKNSEARLKELKAELERRAKEMPLGIPLTSSANGRVLGTYYFYFTSDKSKKLFDERLKEYVEALQKLANVEPIDIKALLPLLPKGYVAMDKDEDWFWFSEKAIMKGTFWDYNNGWCNKICAFNIKPAENWETSLMECGL